VNQYEYLQLMLGAKYQLEKDDLLLITAIATVLRGRNIEVTFASAPLFGQLNGEEGHSERHQLYKVVTQGMAYWELTQALGGVDNKYRAASYLREIMNGRGGTPSIRKVAMVLVSEWEVPAPPPVSAEDMAGTDRQDEARPAHDGWLATGKYKVEGEEGEKTYDLDAKNGEDGEPAVVTIARLIRASWDPVLNQVDPVRLEKVSLMLGHVLMGERQQMIAQLEEAKKAAKPEPVSIWPKNKEHWIFDARYSALQAPWALNKDYPCRQAIEDVVRSAARFAVSRASGMGNSRVFNIEGFVENVVLGLFGDGTNEKDFDFSKLVFREKTPAAEAAGTTIHFEAPLEAAATPAPAAEPAGGESEAEVGK